MAVNGMFKYKLLSVVRFDCSRVRDLEATNKHANIYTENMVVSVAFIAGFLACFLNKKLIRPVYRSCQIQMAIVG